jgi:MGT family glycosyltransferase
MAKIVVLSVPAFGHLNPVLPVVAELVRRGHEVVVYNEPEFEPLIRAQGAGFIAYPPAMSLADLTRVLNGGNLIAGFELFLSATDPLMAFCMERLPVEKPDVIVYDGIAIWGEMAAKRLGLRSVATAPFFVFELIKHWVSWWELIGHTRNFIPRMHKLLALRLKLMRWRAFPIRSPLFPMRGDATIMFSTREIHPATSVFDNSWHLVGASINAVTRPDSFDFGRLDGRPVVYVSLGTLHISNRGFFEMCLGALAGLPAQVLVSVGRGADVAALGEIPENFIVQETFPQLRVLERTSLFVTHAGLNSVHEALYYGVPMVAVPQQFEQLRNAMQMGRKGAGVILDAECYHRRVTGAELRAAVETVMANPAYAGASKALGASLHEAGGYRQAADVIEKVAINQ